MHVISIWITNMDNSLDFFGDILTLRMPHGTAPALFPSVKDK